MAKATAHPNAEPRRKPTHWVTMRGQRIPIVFPEGRPRRILYETAPEERRETGQQIELGVNAPLMWHYAALASFEKWTMPRISVREAFQNSRDAVAAVGGEGAITLTVPAYGAPGDASFADTGIGMDAHTVVTKLLTLGESGKRDDPNSVGGFGIAKATIFGLPDVSAGESWELRTRDLALISDEVGVGLTGLRVVPAREGTEITWRGLDSRKLEQIRAGWAKYVATSDFPKTMNVQRSGVLPTAPVHKPGKVMAEETFGSTKATARFMTARDAERFNKECDEAGLGNFPYQSYERYRIVRLNGLTQLVDFQGDMPGVLFIDLETTARPSEADYPFDPNRTTLRSEGLNEWMLSVADKLKNKDVAITEKMPEIIWATYNFDSAINGSMTDFAAALNVAYRGLSQAKCPKRVTSKYQAIPSYLAVTEMAPRVDVLPGEQPSKQYMEHETADDLSHSLKRSGEFRLTHNQVFALHLARYAASYIVSALSGNPTMVDVHGARSVTAKTVGGEKAGKVLAFIGPLPNGRQAIGYPMGALMENVGKLSTFPEAYAYLRESVVHELIHLTYSDHTDPKFTAALGDMQRDALAFVDVPLRTEMERLWKAYYGA